MLGVNGDYDGREPYSILCSCNIIVR